jgi:hypothetical protein
MSNAHGTAAKTNASAEYWKSELCAYCIHGKSRHNASFSQRWKSNNEIHIPQPSDPRMILAEAIALTAAPGDIPNRIKGHAKISVPGAHQEIQPDTFRLRSFGSAITKEFGLGEAPPRYC